ncbi:hypothetical protein OHA79_51745 (plasmid) [Streptomyces sp. NBC_00841]|jgi:succinate dehydrogenase hydrophobic anchor subunit|uniref:DUF2231 domain-containing protein n=1 Tax=unclassified Streptomyces TaxID=2593676 RepID=UPI00225BB7B8|nr:MULTISPECIES: DUF2231 domain-containing protein [unclassified Streptomyces]MCX4539023.1 hypothetical protein [Streptomyces sp. NBC_01669]WSA04192.1 hypothetical protein OHA79_44370 [Streptomyces sp. NBC_00841]WSA04731.1 hypothetical protein OHA79_44385 [Streptomyces sp. NBC_00841]WSA04755.1 hypothetical protein OHA79_44525 [Streptomyces sp. NBC_00841]WSA05961.1 hypothetical protein OHA79_51745 [Streptomyces sp. NBC_00841]
MSLINGLPAHVLLVHAVVVLVPLSALMLVICALWPQAARRLGLALPLLALVTLATVPLATQAGEWLERHVDSDPLVRRHAELGDGMLPWALGLFVLAAGVWWISRRTGAPQSRELSGARSGARSWSVLHVAAAVLSVVVAAGAIVDVYRIGDSGAKAAWHDAYSKTATKPSDGD